MVIGPIVLITPKHGPLLVYVVVLVLICLYVTVPLLLHKCNVNVNGFGLNGLDVPLNVEVEIPPEYRAAIAMMF
jgi:hypothetical protein